MNQNNSTNNTPMVEPTQEVRFAVVMYGGVSLAIYINGIAQELLELVKATAPDGTNAPAKIPTNQLSGSGKVYRKIGQFLGSELAKKSQPKASDIKPNMSISARFVIDILSGTSAGGINAIFLAKALANDQSMDKLKELWVNEGDINKLINDAKSIKDLPGVRLKSKPESLLNSQRMYLKLLEALEGMDEQTNSSASVYSPYVDELDLYVTATNIRGQVIPIQLKDKTVAENRHRQVFHFAFSEKDQNLDDNFNDFSRKYTPFLAFAARCTSAFPLAFEPMTLDDAINLLKLKDRYNPEDVEEWKQKFFAFTTDVSQSIVRRNLIEPEKIAFGDGGYLDNKPFSYATEALLRRRSDLPIKRHLIYIDPSPEMIENSIDFEKPNAIENSLAALLTLPRYETIREDIERIINRNRLIRRIGRIANDSKIEKDVEVFNKQYDQHNAQKSQGGEDWKKIGLDDLIKERGISYGSYHRLKIFSITDDLAQLITRVAGFNCNDESAEFLAIRLFIEQWREENYCESSHDPNRRTQTEFLMNFDFDYRLRRLRFLRRKINELYALQDSAWIILQRLQAENSRLNHLISLPENLNQFIEQDSQNFRNELRKIKNQISQVIIDLLRLKYNLERVNRVQKKIDFDLERFRKCVEDVKIERDYLRYILQGYVEANQKGAVPAFQREKVKPVVNDKKIELENLANILAEIYKKSFDKAVQDCQSVMNLEEKNFTDGSYWARRCVKHYYDAYENYDMVIFPIIYGTDVGEADEVDIIRISSEDATSIINEREKKLRKLAGSSYYAFGGFFDKKWREDDILWGRLDGAERLIATLLPGENYKNLRDELIKEAHQGILGEELKAVEKQQLLNTMFDQVANFLPPDEIAIAKENLGKLKSIFDNRTLYNFFQNSYQDNQIVEKNRQLSPEILLGYFSRSTQVFGDLLEGLPVRRNPTRGVAPWLSRLGRLIWGLVAVASPRPSVFNLSFKKYWLPLIYFIEIFLIFVGFLLTQKAVQSFGFLTFAITLALTLTIWLLEDFIQGQNKAAKIIRISLILVGTILVVLGVYHFSKYGLSDVFLSLQLWIKRFLNP